MAELSSKICLAGEGKGRWKSAKSKYIFSFESEVSWKDRNWLLIGSLPVYGEEFVKLSWENEFRDVNIEGSLYKKFLNDPASERRSNHNSKKSLDEFLLEWLKLSSKLMNSPNDFVASPDDWRVERVEDGVMLWRKLTNGEVFRWKSSRLADKFFTKSELSLHRAQDSKLLNLFKLTLFYSDCHTAQ